MRHGVPSTALVALLLLGACGAPPGSRPAPPGAAGTEDHVPGPVPRAEPRSKYGNPESYVVRGRRYRVLASSEGYVERGIASWYGPKFHGRRTSSGETYDMHKMTAAHRALPLPSYVLVTHLENGRRAVVRVNDRGPFHGDRLIDLSYAAAGHLGLRDSGTAPVEVRVLRPGEHPAGVPGQAPRRIRLLQAGAFVEARRARALARRIRALGETVRIEQLRLDGLLYHRVWVGPYRSPGTLKAARGRLRDLQVEAFEVSHAVLRRVQPRSCRVPTGRFPPVARCRVR